MINYKDIYSLYIDHKKADDFFRTIQEAYPWTDVIWDWPGSLAMNLKMWDKRFLITWNYWKVKDQVFQLLKNQKQFKN